MLTPTSQTATAAARHILRDSRAVCDVPRVDVAGRTVRCVVASPYIFSSLLQNTWLACARQFFVRRYAICSPPERSLISSLYRMAVPMPFTHFYNPLFPYLMIPSVVHFFVSCRHVCSYLLFAIYLCLILHINMDLLSCCYRILCIFAHFIRC